MSEGRRRLRRLSDELAGPAKIVLCTVALATALVPLLAMAAVGADPSPSPLGYLTGGDPRSDGGGPGLMGSPLGVLLGVVAVGLATVLITALLARLSRRP